MGVKEQGLMTGTYFFLGLFLVAALLIGEYAAFTTVNKKNGAAHANRT